jgi:hypothetical protein
MDEQRFDPAQERDALSAAIGAVHTHWGTAQMSHAYVALVHAVARAKLALSVLEPQHATYDTALRIHVLGLRCMTMVAQEEIARVERFALAVVEKERAFPPYLH